MCTSDLHTRLLRPCSDTIVQSRLQRSIIRPSRRCGRLWIDRGSVLAGELCNCTSCGHVQLYGSNVYLGGFNLVDRIIFGISNFKASREILISMKFTMLVICREIISRARLFRLLSEPIRRNKSGRQYLLITY